LNIITWHLALQTLQALLPHEVLLSNSISASDPATLLYISANCSKDIELLFQPYDEFLSYLKVYSIDFEMLCQTHLFGDVLQMDLHHRKLAKPPALVFYDSPLF
jgi:hypothetical protein